MASKNGSPAKRRKQKDHTLKLKRHAFMAEEFVVYAIDGVSAGVKWIRTGEETKVAPFEADILEKSRAEFRVWVGAVGRIDGEEKIEMVEITTSRCLGTDLTPHLSQIATEQARLIGKDHVLTTFYFATANKTAPFEDWQVYQWLQDADAFNKLCTYKEYVMDTLDAMITKLDEMKSKVDDVQVGGSHYSRLEIQPRHLYIPLQLHWDFANALKYIVRFEHKKDISAVEYLDAFVMGVFGELFEIEDEQSRANLMYALKFSIIPRGEDNDIPTT